MLSNNENDKVNNQQSNHPVNSEPFNNVALSDSDDDFQDASDILPQEVLDKLNISEDEEKLLIQESETLKTKANTLYTSKEYNQAIELYTEALSLLSPTTTSQKRLKCLLNGNISACHYNLEQWEKAIEYCTKSLKYDGDFVKILQRRAKSIENMERAYNQTNNTGESFKYGMLQMALNDHKKLISLTSPLPNSHTKVTTLPRQIEQLQEKERTEMLEKLKDLGNNFLGKFGLSTDMFNVNNNKDGKEGGFSININQKK